MRRAGQAIAALLAVSAALAGCSPSGSEGAARSVVTAVSRDPASALPPHRSICGGRKHADYRHVIWIWLENRSYQQVLGSSGGAPRLRAFARRCGVATDYRAITHPSLPNYMAATSGSTHGITSDCDPQDCSVSGPSLYSQLSGRPAGWRAYDEGMARRCDRASYGEYAARHNPAVYYRDVRRTCLHRDIPMGGSHGRFAHDLRTGRLPAFSFVTPNLCDDGHDCSTATADRWVGYWLRRIVRSSAYRSGSTAVFVTADEGTTSTNQVVCVVIAPTVPRGTRAGVRATHYSLLRTTEGLLGLPALGAARSATSLAKPFHLGKPRG
jgi:phospholipase C